MDLKIWGGSVWARSRTSIKTELDKILYRASYVSLVESNHRSSDALFDLSINLYIFFYEFHSSKYINIMLIFPWFMCSIHINYLGHSLAIIISKQTLDPSLFACRNFMIKEHHFVNEMLFCKRSILGLYRVSLISLSPFCHLVFTVLSFDSLFSIFFHFLQSSIFFLLSFFLIKILSAKLSLTQTKKGSRFVY